MPSPRLSLHLTCELWVLLQQLCTAQTTHTHMETAVSNKPEHSRRLSRSLGRGSVVSRERSRRAAGSLSPLSLLLGNIACRQPSLILKVTEARERWQALRRLEPPRATNRRPKRLRRPSVLG